MLIKKKVLIKITISIVATWKTIKNNCTICDDNKQRILLSISPSKCICKDGYFDDGIGEECKMCY